MLLLLCAAACGTGQQRYRNLSFFFDGVPDPDKPPAEETKKTASGGAREATSAGSTHDPYSKRECKVCHPEMEKGGGGGGIFSAKTADYEQAWKSCKTCHSDPAKVAATAVVMREGAWLHGPVAAGDCRACHEPHQSPFPHLMRAERSEAACRKCHDTLAPRAGPMADLDCSACHDPHMGSGSAAMFLRGAGEDVCGKCHVLNRADRPWLHGPVATGACALCHDAHGREGSEKNVRRPIAPVCGKCHEQAALSEVHRADPRECDVCHEPHAATQASDLFDRERIERARPGSRAFLPLPAAPSAEPAPAQPEDQRPRTSSS